MLDAFTVFDARLRIAFTSPCREYLPPNCQQHCVPMVSRSLRKGSDGMCTGISTEMIGVALSQATDSFVETATNRAWFTRSRKSEITELRILATRGINSGRGIVMVPAVKAGLERMLDGIDCE
ncbi:hypothetical protein ACOME3_007773 [Neoechinorhynchus agilis]